MSDWRVAGRYVEGCNCEAICPCRSVGGRDGTRARYQLCQFALAWTIDEGHFHQLEMAGLQAVMAGYWDEDEEGAPWRVQLYVDDRASGPQREALADVFLGRAGGTPARNYAMAIKHVYAIEPAAIEVVHERGGQRVRVGEAVEIRARSTFSSPETVACGIPGLDRPGEELVHETLRVATGALSFEFHGRCGFSTTFDYTG